MSDVMMTTADGETLEGEFFIPEGSGGTPPLAVVITHPHPLMGGDMYTPVPAGFFSSLGTLGVAGLRFNFRGVGRSSGTHDKGGAERLDVAAAIAHIASAIPEASVVLAGWSFGADVSLTIEDERVIGWFLAAPPLSVVDPEEMAAQSSSAPKMLAIGQNDQFNDPAKAHAATASWTNTTIETIDGADHFFGAQLPTLIGSFSTFITDLAD